MSRIGWIVMCSLAVLTGCSSNLKPVTTRVDSVTVDERTEQGVRVLVTVLAENPNDVALPIVRARYEVEMAGAETFAFTELPKATLPANGTQTITLPAAFATESGNAAGHSYQVKGQLTYEPPGEIRKLLTEYGVPLPSASFKDDGALN